MNNPKSGSYLLRSGIDLDIVRGNSNIMKLAVHQRAPFALRYLMPEAVEAYLAQLADQILCVVGFGVGSHSVKPDCPVLWVDMPVFGSDAVYEVWNSNKPVKQYQDGSIIGAGNEDIFFGSISIQTDLAEDLSAVAQHAYACIFDFLQRSTCTYLLRVWNYFPGINSFEKGMERYHRFNIGRHEAFVRYNKKIEESPAACALGSHGGPLVIYFLAARSPMLQIENPRQISAYHYPEQYGPRSPTFSRATLAFHDTARTLFISGTASILGCETVHLGSVSLQTRETLANIRALIDQAGQEGFEPWDFRSNLALKAYVRYAEDFGVVRGIIQNEWGALEELVVLQADICRPDLLVEIEAVCWGGTR